MTENDEGRLHSAPATTDQLVPMLAPAAVVTPLQAWVTALVDLLADARGELAWREFETFVDIALIRLARDAFALGLDEWRAA